MWDYIRTGPYPARHEDGALKNDDMEKIHSRFAEHARGTA